MNDKDDLNPDAVFEELLGHLRAIGLAHRHVKFFEYLVWEWHTRQQSRTATTAEGMAIGQAMDAGDEVVEALLHDSDPRTRDAYLNLLERLRMLREPL